MEALMVGPALLWLGWALFLVKKKKRQWPEILCGIVGGLILAKLMPDTVNTVYNVVEQIWTGLLGIFQSIVS